MPKIIHKGIVYGGAPVDPEKGYVSGDLYDEDEETLETIPVDADTLGGIYTKDDIRGILGSIAKEEDETATKVHTVGELILFKKKLYKVSSAIAIGDSVVDGTNVEETDVANEIQEAKALKEIKEATAQWTTDNYGSAKLFVISDHPTRRVLNAFADNNMRCLLFLGWNSAAYGVTVFDIATNNIVKQTPVTVTYQYVEL